MPNCIRRDFVFLLAFTLSYCCCGTQDIPAQDVLTNKALIVGDVPEPPTGYLNRQLCLAAIATGREPVIDQSMKKRGVTVRRNIPYSTVSPTTKLDLYLPPTGTAVQRGLVFIHGGAWKGGRKEDYAYYGQTFAAKGFVVASVGYRLSGEAKYPAAVQDCKTAVRWMKANAKEYNFDPDRIGVVGGSAGGHLSLMIGYSSDVAELEGIGHLDQTSRVKSVVALYPPTDFSTAFARENDGARRLVESFLGASYDAQPNIHHQASPITHVSADDPPTLLIHGTIDEVVPYNQSPLLIEKLVQHQIPHHLDTLTGWPHSLDLSQRVNDRCVWMMERFFATTLEMSALESP